MYPLVMGLITTFPFACACMFSTIDLEAIPGSAISLPLIEIYYQGTGSKAGASVLMALLPFCFFGCFVDNDTDFQITHVELLANTKPSNNVFSQTMGRVPGRRVSILPPLDARCPQTQ
jgi:hypothetical protein